MIIKAQWKVNNVWKSKIYYGKLVWVRTAYNSDIIFQYDDGIKYHDICCTLISIED